MRTRRKVVGFSVFLIAVFIIFRIWLTNRISFYSAEDKFKYDCFYYYDTSKETTNRIILENQCPLQLNYTQETDIQMLNLYDQLKFDNPDGGIWKQGWDIKVSAKKWNRFNKLKVFVVPHSHNDPGWRKTADEYYALYTKDILDNMLEKLSLDIRRKFIWAEVSYFAMWWKDIDNIKRDMVKKLVDNNQLEFVSGGWVMNDESSSYWVSTLMQFIEGHQWLKKNLNCTSRTSWSIDPFGLSTTQAFLLKRMGLENMVIQRVHYSIKKELALKKQLEFRWRQIWDGTGSTDIFTHILPFSFYDIPFSCGPDPKICCQFDFKRLPGMGEECPWHLHAQNITDYNVAERAELLLDQYRKKSELFRSNILLVTVGDDFRFNTAAEWDLQYGNYQKIFDYLNYNEELNVQVRFATLSEYFDALKSNTPSSNFPVLSGDFFTYADRDDHYWSGTYTSKPFYKQLDRVLLSYIRAADVLLVKLNLKIAYALQEARFNKMEILIVEARQVLALFQHHDGLSGTAHEHVIYDYGEKMLKAINNCQKVIQEAIEIMLTPNPSATCKEEIYYDIDDIRHNYNNFADHYIIKIDQQQNPRRVVLFNSLTFMRHEVVTFITTSPFIEVRDYRLQRVIAQISPSFDNNNCIQHDRYQVSFIADVPALGMSTYLIKRVPEHLKPMETIIASIQAYNFKQRLQENGPFRNFEMIKTGKEFILSNSRVIALFNEKGLLKAVKTSQRIVPIKVGFAKYNNKLGGPHLFLPKRYAVPLSKSSVSVLVVKGPIFSTVTAELPYVTHITTIHNSPGADGLGIDIKNIVNITGNTNFTLVMRFMTIIENNDEFFTDSNGYQFLRRKSLKKLPIQGNFYPMPTMSYIEDRNTRVTVITDTPVGVTSLSKGQLEVTLDQKSKRYNNLLVEDVHEKNPVVHTFKLLVEVRSVNCQNIPDDHPSGFPTLSTHISQQILLNPLVKLISAKKYESSLNTVHGSFTKEFGVDYSIVLLRTLTTGDRKNATGIILHRQYLDLCFANQMLLNGFQISKDGKVNIGSLFGTEIKLREASVSFTALGKELEISKNISLCPMEVQAYIMEPH